MTADQKKLLLDTCDWIEQNVPPERFNLSIFWEDDDSRHDEPHCGSAGCFLGYAARAPMCVAAGLTHQDGGIPAFAENGKGFFTLFGFNVARPLFGIPLDHATWLFDPSGYNPDDEETTTLPRVLSRVRSYANGGWIPPSHHPDDEV